MYIRKLGRSKSFFVSAVIAVLLPACLKSPQQVLLPTHTQSTQAIGTPVVQLPTLTDTIESQQPRSDGRLRLSIKNTSSQCYKPGTPIPLMFTYENLTDETITIVDYNIMSVNVVYGGKGQLIPVITDDNGEEVITPQHNQRVEVVNINPPLFQDLPPKSLTDLIVDYYFPLQVIDPDNEKLSYPAPSGVYFLEFIYIGYENSGVWQGSISSNQIDICITENI